MDHRDHARLATAQQRRVRDVRRVELRPGHRLEPCEIDRLDALLVRAGWALIDGVRWIRLDALDQVEPYCAARVANISVERGPDDEIAALDVQLRDVARKFADATPPLRERTLTWLNDTKDIGQLADLMMACRPMLVADSASYASETDLSRRLQRAIAVLESELAKTSAAPPPE